MGHAIHRNGNQYRMWSTIVDRYITDPMTREEMAAWVREDAIQTLLERIGPDTEQRLDRADKHGSSGHGRDADCWEPELCDRGRFHHAFILRPSDGKCSHCGEPEDDHAHLPTCMIEEAEDAPGE